MSSSAARARDEDQLVFGALLPAVHGRFTSSRSYLSPDLSSSYRVAFIIFWCAAPRRIVAHRETGDGQLSPRQRSALESVCGPSTGTQVSIANAARKFTCGGTFGERAGGSRSGRLALHFRSFDYQRSSSHRSHSRCASRSRTPTEREVTCSRLKCRIWPRPPSW